MDIPVCPNHQEHRCERSELRLIGESEQAFLFHCFCCKLYWAVSKPREKQSARWINKMRNIQKLTEEERLRSSQPKVFGSSYKGLVHI